MDARRPEDNTALDLVQEFQALDVDDVERINVQDADVATKLRRPFGHGSGDGETLESSIGGADLSGILAFDGDDDEDKVRGSDADAPTDIFSVREEDVVNRFQTVKVSCDACGTEHDGLLKICKSCGELDVPEPGNTSHHTSANRSSAASLLDSQSHPISAKATTISSSRNDVQDKSEVESEGWDSDERKPEKKAAVPIANAHSAACYASGSASSSANECSNQNMLSPMRPTEASSDWDYVEQGSNGAAADSDSDENNMLAPRPNSSKSYDEKTLQDTYPIRSVTVTAVAEDGRDGGETKQPAAVSRNQKGQSNPQITDIPRGDPLPLYREYEGGTPQSGKRGSRQAMEATQPASRIDDKAEGSDSLEVAIDGRGPSNKDNRNLPAHVVVAQCSSFSTVINSAGTEAAATGVVERSAAAAATIEALKAELNLLKEHVLLSERKREAQLKELHTRLDAQERRNRLPTDGRELRETEVDKRGEVDSTVGTPEPVGGARFSEEHVGGIASPSTGVSNPFAAQQGGAVTTPRDHFPAFEDALHDAGSDDCAAPGAEDGRVDDEDNEGDKSSRSEGFDFSIDTLSHINNHTDFGTEAPVALPVVTMQSASGKGVGRSRQKATGGLERDPRTSGSNIHVHSTEEEPDEVFDAQGAAAEEAFFADACATATLQTPVKHVLATGSGASDTVAGVVVRRTRRKDSRGARGTPAERPGSAVAEVSLEVTEKRVESAVLCISGQPESPDLCMADLFARATRELDESVESVIGEEPPAAATAPQRASVCFPRSENATPAGIDAGTQTTWTFSGHEGVRFLSTPLRTPLRTLVEAGKDVAPGSDGLVGWGLKYPVERKAGFPPIEEDLGREDTIDPHAQLTEDRGSFCTPRRSQPPLWRTPIDSTKAEESHKLSAGPGGDLSGASTFFGSPGLSPIADARPCSECDEPVVHDCGDANGRSMANMAEDGAAGGNAGGNEQDDTARAAAPGPQFERMLDGCLPIMRANDRGTRSEADKSHPSSTALAARSVAKVAACVEVAPAQAETGEKTSRGRDGRGVGDWDCNRGVALKGQRELPRFEGQHRASAAFRLTSRTPAVHESSVNTSGLSLLRASSTLETMTFLEDNSRSYVSYSRGGSSFPGELFADSRLRESRTSNVRHSQEAAPPTEHRLQRGKWLIAPSPPGGAVRRPKSAPTVPLERTLTDRPLQQRVLQEKTACGVPPEIVEAWLAAAMERFYGDHRDTTGNNQISQEGTAPIVDCEVRNALQEYLPTRAGPLDLDLALARSPLRDLRRRRANPAALLKEARTMGIQDKDVRFEYARALATPSSAYPMSRADSPPPPPPPAGDLGLADRCVDGNVLATSNEDEEIFYKRQRLLHRAVTAAARQDGVMPLSVRGSDIRSTDIERFAFRDEPAEERENVFAGHHEERRHSDPSSWKAPPSAVTVGQGESAANGTGTMLATGEGAVGWAARGISPYLRRRTSGYWRDRLGMTQ